VGSAGASALSPVASRAAVGRVYHAYGLRIRSAFALPGPPVEGEQADVAVRCDALPRDLPAGASTDYWFRVDGGEVMIYSAGVAAALLQEGRRVTVDPAPGVAGALLQSFLLGPVLAFLLHQRGLLVLHASAVRIGAGAVAFLGAPGAGKSSTAAALYARGHAVIADDLVAAQTEAAPPLVFPGFPLLRLCRDTWDRYAAGEAAWEEPGAEEGKSIWVAARGFRSSPLPLQRLYVLTDGGGLDLDPMPPAPAVVELARQTFAGRRHAGAARAHLHQCEALARSGVMRRLCRRPDLSLEVLARLVEEDSSSAAS
jgi:hypothetical protein